MELKPYDCKRIGEELRKKLEEITPELENRDFVILSDFTIEFLPPDWERYNMYGCDTDGGNYCLYVVPAVYRDSKGKIWFYIVRYSSCEIGNPVVVAEVPGSGLSVFEEKYLTEDDTVVYNPWHPDFELEEVDSAEELINVIVAECESSNTEYEEYLKWFEGKEDYGGEEDED